MYVYFFVNCGTKQKFLDKYNLEFSLDHLRAIPLEKTPGDGVLCQISLDNKVVVRNFEITS